MCRDKSLIPNLLNVEQLNEYFIRTLPPITQGEIEFYDKKELITWNNEYNEQQSADHPLYNAKGDLIEPSLHFHEFLFLLGLIAKNRMPNGNERPIEEVLKEFYIRKLEFEQVDEDNARKDLVLEEIIEHLQQGTDYIEAGEYDTDEGENLWDDSDEDEGLVMAGGNHKALLALQEARLLEE